MDYRIKMDLIIEPDLSITNHFKKNVNDHYQVNL